MAAALRILVLLGLVLAPRAEACSCMLAKKSTRAQEVREALSDADSVFVARLRYSTLTPDTTYPGAINEDAEFEITEVFKGESKPGQLILVHQIVGRGACALSSTNDPPWLMNIEKAGDEDPVQVPMTLSKEWLIYAYGPEPYELGSCTRTMPLNVGGEKDVEVLRKLTRLSRKQSSSVSLSDTLR